MAQTTPKTTRIAVFRNPTCRTNQLSKYTWMEAIVAPRGIRLARPFRGSGHTPFNLNQRPVVPRRSRWRTAANLDSGRHTGLESIPRRRSGTGGTTRKNTYWPRNTDSRYRAFKSPSRSEEHTSELQSRFELVCRLLLEK